MSDTVRAGDRRAYSRRDALRIGAGSVLALAGAGSVPAPADAGRRPAADRPRLHQVRLRAAPARTRMVGREYPQTPVWVYNDTLPGPLIRARRGDRIQVHVGNALGQDTTVHWHGIRLPNAMDGVPHLTQPPIADGGSFVYEFDLPDAGSYWYHPHSNSAEQVGRGLYGALIVDEMPQPDTPAPVFDRDLVWLLDDWRLDRDAAIQPFGNGHDITHGGRLGNTVTINGRLPETLTVHAGERLRLRLINVANARHFALQFEEHAPYVIAIDGQPVTPHRPDDGRYLLPPAGRLDLALNAGAAPGARARIVDSFYRDAFLLTDLRYDDRPPLRDTGDDAPPPLPANALPAPDLSRAQTYRVTFAGGAMGGMRGARLDGAWTDIRTLMTRHGLVWAINGIASAGEHPGAPLLTLQRGRSYRLLLENDSAFPHPAHLHGHHYRVLSRNGRAVAHTPWQDSVLLMPDDRVEVAFVADNPGDWMFHCHIPEHMQAGMMAMIRVA